MKEGFDVFLAYNSKDRRFVKGIYHELKRRQINAWVDFIHLPKGRETTMKEQIFEAIPKSRAAVIVITDKGPGDWQKNEIQHIITQCKKSKRKPITPVRLRCNNFDGIFECLKGYKAVDFKKNNDQEKISELISRIIDYDVLVAYNDTNRRDDINRKKIELLCNKLEKKHGLKSWFREGIVPVDKDSHKVELAIIPVIKKIAVIVDAANPKQWNERKWENFFNECHNCKRDIIPILLPGIEEIPDELKEQIGGSAQEQREFRAICFNKKIEKDHEAIKHLALTIKDQPLIERPAPWLLDRLWKSSRAGKKMIGLLVTLAVFLFFIGTFFKDAPLRAEITTSPSISTIFVGSNTKEIKLGIQAGTPVRVKWECFGPGTLGEKQDDVHRSYFPPETLEDYQQKDVKIVATITDNDDQEISRSVAFNLINLKTLDTILDIADLSYSFIKKTKLPFDEGSYAVSTKGKELLQELVDETMAKKVKFGEPYQGKQPVMKFTVTCYADKTGFSGGTERKLKEEIRKSGKEIPTDPEERRKALNQQYSIWRAKSIISYLNNYILQVAKNFNYTNIQKVDAKGEEKPQRLCEVESYIVELDD